MNEHVRSMDNDIWSVVDLRRRVVDQRWAMDNNIVLLRSFRALAMSMLGMLGLRHT